MAVSLFRRSSVDREDWMRVRVLLGATVAMVYFDYFWSIREPQAHAFYVVFPVAVLFAATCWQVWSRSNPNAWTRWARVAAVVLVLRRARAHRLGVGIGGRVTRCMPIAPWRRPPSIAGTTDCWAIAVSG
jgi:hypothetical protein